MKLHSGQIITRYRLTEPIGQGGMGFVWRAEDLELHRPVALKFLHESALEGEEAHARFLREARTAASLNHPGICTIYEVGQFQPEGGSEPQRFLAMELVEGRTLQSVLEQGPLTLATLQDVALQVAEALAAAHEGGVVHRDLKPGNIMISEDGRTKILDFGLAKPQVTAGLSGDDATAALTVTPVTREGTIVGTFSYLSPEQAEGKPVDSRSDVFSFGVMLYELSTGKLPFRGDTPTSTLAKILEVEPEPALSVRGELPEYLALVVQRCLNKKPENRYNDTRDLVAALRHRSDDSIAGSAGLAAGSQSTATSSRRARWTGGVLLVAVALAIAAIGYMRINKPESAAAPATAQALSIAVLPFDNLSAEAENEYFAAGMTEEIINKLSRIEGLQIASRSSVAPYKSAERDARRIGTDLAVNYLLEGSVRRAGARVRITAQLVNTSTGFQMWSQEFEGTLDDVFRIQEETALKIADQLNLELTPQEEEAVQARVTDNPEAYDAYLRSQVLLADWSDREKVETAGRYLEEALEKDPDYALALAGLASVQAQMYRNFTPSPSLIERAAENAERAFAMAPELPRAAMAVGEIASMRFDYHKGARMFGEVVRMTPKDPLAWDFLSWALGYQQPPDTEGAIDAAQEAIRLQPDFPGAYYHLGRALLLEGKHEEARDAFERALEQNPDFTAGHMGLAQYHLAVGEHQQALHELDIVEKYTGIERFYRATIHADRGDIDEALKVLREALENGFRDFAMIHASPYLAKLEADPRFEKLLQSYR